MNIEMLKLMLGLKTITWAPEDEGGSGGGEGGDTGAGGDETGDAGSETQTDGTVLGGGQADEKSGEGSEEGDKSAKDEESGDPKDGKSEGDKGDEKTGESDGGADEVPEDGSYDFEMPEGVELSDEDKQQWSETFKELGLTRAQAAKLVENQSQKALAEQQAYSDFLQNQQNEHLEAAKADKEIGGDKWEESTRLANLGLEALGNTGAIKNLILTSGNGNNPDMIRELRRIGEMVKDDTFDNGSTHEEPVSRETSWYGGTTPGSKKG